MIDDKALTGNRTDFLREKLKPLVFATMNTANMSYQYS